MKILKQSSKLIFLLLLFSFFTSKINSNEAVDIWNLNKEKKKEQNISINDLKSDDEDEISQISLENKNIEILKEENLDKNKILLVGLYDPAENNLDIDMWTKTDGKEIIKK